VKSLHGFCHSVIPDRIETATYVIAAAATRGNVTITHTNPAHIGHVLKKIVSAGVSVQCTADTIHVRWTQPLKPVTITTAVFPGFPTDVQAQWMALMSLVDGKSAIRETVFENRFLHVAELQRLGANIRIKGNTVQVTGVKQISGAPVMASDLRAGAALVIAGLIAQGRTEVLRVYHLDRGYECLEKKLRSLGADIRRVPQ
jgi:UDP-N-acetylglucosamine 1-carboxyvinyltransferase